MIVTIDTNVIFQAFRNPTGPSGYIIKLAEKQKIDLALSNPVVTEYEDVLTRPTSLKQFGLTQSEVEDVLSQIVRRGNKFLIFFLFRPNLPDEADNMLVELALTSASRFLITNNVKDFVVNNELNFDDLQIVTPANFLNWWRQLHD